MFKRISAVALAALGVVSSLQASSVAGEKFLVETFSDDSWKDKWVESNWKGEEMGEWEHTNGLWHSDEVRDLGLRVNSDFRFHTIATKFDKAVSNKEQDLVVQFSVKHEKKEYSFCGGGYIKLLPSDIDLKTWGGDSLYHIMFGPDLCGHNIARVHTIFNHKGENLLKKEDIKIDEGKKTAFTHLYTLVLHPDKTYTVYVDMEEVSSGSLWDQWDFPAKVIDDPASVKPQDWVDQKTIPDPEDKKPDGWDDIPSEITDPSAVKPDDWDDEDDGEWEAPIIANPEFKGAWKPKIIKNPAYKGEWTPATIENPDYDPVIANYEDIGAVGFELWTVNAGSIFDNVFIGNDYEEAKKFAEETFALTMAGEREAKNAYDDATAAKRKAEADFQKEMEAMEELEKDEL